MSHDWLRLWHDLPTDPKFRTISRISKQPISVVISIYIFMLVDASNATERGRTHMNSEDIATALDIEIQNVESVREAMQGRLLDQNYLTGWERRQPKREDGSADRARAWRENQRLQKELDEALRTQPNATELKKTQIRLDKDKEIDIRISISNEAFEKFFAAYPKKTNRVDALKVFNKNKLHKNIDQILDDIKNRTLKHTQWQDKQFIPGPDKYLRKKLWNDEIITTQEIKHAVKTSLSYSAKVNQENWESNMRALEYHESDDTRS